MMEDPAMETTLGSGGPCTLGSPFSLEPCVLRVISLDIEFVRWVGNGNGLLALFGRTVAISDERILAGAKGIPTPGKIIDGSRPGQLGVGLLGEGIDKDDFIDVGYSGRE